MATEQAVVVIGEFRFPAERLAEAASAMARVITASRAEPGCIGYSYAADVLDPGLMRVSEHWTTRAALDAHFAAPHMDTWRREREELGMTGRKVRVYAVSEGEAL